MKTEQTSQFSVDRAMFQHTNLLDGLRENAKSVSTRKDFESAVVKTIMEGKYVVVNENFKLWSGDVVDLIKTLYSNCDNIKSLFGLINALAKPFHFPDPEYPRGAGYGAFVGILASRKWIDELSSSKEEARKHVEALDDLVFQVGRGCLELEYHKHGRYFNNSHWWAEQKDGYGGKHPTLELINRTIDQWMLQGKAGTQVELPDRKRILSLGKRLLSYAEEEMKLSGVEDEKIYPKYASPLREVLVRLANYRLKLMADQESVLKLNNLFTAE